MFFNGLAVEKDHGCVFAFGFFDDAGGSEPIYHVYDKYFTTVIQCGYNLFVLRILRKFAVVERKSEIVGKTVAQRIRHFTYKSILFVVNENFRFVVVLFTCGRRKQRKDQKTED